MANDKLTFEASTIEWIAAAAGAQAATDETPKKFKMRAYTGGPMLVGYYGSPVIVDLAGLKAEAPLPILLNHDISRIVGHADEITVGEKTLDLAGLISGAGPDADQVLGAAKRGFPWKASVGARPDKMEFVGEGVQTAVNGKTFTGPLYVARKSTLGEVSFVPMAADPKTSAKVAATRKDSKMLDEPHAVTGDEIARLEANFHSAAPAPQLEQQRLALIKCWAPKPDATWNAEDSANAAELTAQAMAGEIGLDQLRLGAVALIRKQRPTGPAIHSSSRDVSRDVVQAAFCQSAGLRNLDRAFKPDVLEASDRLRGFGVQELLLHCAAEGGYTGRQRITA